MFLVSPCDDVTERFGDNTASANCPDLQRAQYLVWHRVWSPGGNLLAEPPGLLLPQILSDGSGGVAPAWHVTLVALLLMCRYPAVSRLKAWIMRRPLPGTLATRESVVMPLSLELILPWLETLMPTRRARHASGLAIPGRAVSSAEKGAGNDGGLQSRPLLICSPILIPSALCTIPGEMIPAASGRCTCGLESVTESCWSLAILVHVRPFAHGQR